MPLPKATSRADLIRRFRELGWTGPHKPKGRRRGKHIEFMMKGTRTVRLPNDHGTSDIRIKLLGDILDQAQISRKEWLGHDSK